MTVFQYFEDEARFAKMASKVAETKSLFDAFEKDVAKWEGRALKLTVEEAGKLLDDVILWRLIEEVDARVLP